MTKQTPLLHYKQIGTGKHIVLIHGLFGSLENLNMVAKPLAENYCVTSVDVRNHGDSFHASSMQYPELAQDIINLLDHLHIDTCLLLGHSMGGKIAIQVALEHPERVIKLIVADIAPVSYPPHHLKIIEGLQAIDLSRVTKRKDADTQLAAYVDNVGMRQFLLRNLAIDSHGKFAFKCSLDDISLCYAHIMKANQLAANKMPYPGQTLFIKGGDSDYILPEHKKAIAALLPNAKAKIIQGTGHWLHAEKTIAFNKVVADFISTDS
ncbi:alpha/beta fold hydrolase [Colwellia ponticola]|uniref:Alpha/beta fold hydrolase n=1 Tax=Colwellia ponticola TaxID=2304625 RepID=A0A8H2JKE8_9GAMM|nr:alpha/beta fold hydrolase [Colwellia ponticola]TMM44876.1 alpha/beta fold hydrolase [Colwellia ponticola]